MFDRRPFEVIGLRALEPKLAGLFDGDTGRVGNMISVDDLDS